MYGDQFPRPESEESFGHVREGDPLHVHQMSHLDAPASYYGIGPTTPGLVPEVYPAPAEGLLAEDGYGEKSLGPWDEKDLEETLISSSDSGSRKKGDAKDGKKEEYQDEEEWNEKLAHLQPDERKAILDQVLIKKLNTVSLFGLFRYATRQEIIINIIGLLFAMASGVTQPLMSIVFGNLTSDFTNYGQKKARLQQQGGSDQGLANQVQAARDDLEDKIRHDAILLTAIGVAQFGTTYFYMVTWLYTSERIARRVRERYFMSVLRQNIAYFDRLGPGEVASRIETDIHLFQAGIADKIPITFTYLAMFFGGIVVGLVKNWRLALVLCTTVPVIMGIGVTIAKILASYRGKMASYQGQSSIVVEEAVSSIRSIQAFALPRVMLRMFEDLNVMIEHLGLRSCVWVAGTITAYTFVIYSAYALAFFYGTELIYQGNAQSGQVVSTMMAILVGAFSLSMCMPNVQAVASACGAAPKIYETIDRVPVIDSASTEGIRPRTIKGHIELENVKFVYPARPAVTILPGLTLSIPRGKTTALVGASGSGKSTIIGLLERFYNPVSGVVKLDGRNIADLNVRWLRARIGLVGQEPTLFAVSVKANILHGLIGTPYAKASDEEKDRLVVDAAVQANADQFIRALPNGYDTNIGERGMLLSGGQKQRVAIARAIVGNPAILLLDEATSALDTTSEKIVQEALDNASRGRTTITIAHRLSTIRNSDQIVVMRQGEIVEMALTNPKAGSAHKQLLALQGYYANLVEAQTIAQNVTELEVPETSMRAPDHQEYPMYDTSEYLPDKQDYSSEHSHSYVVHTSPSALYRRQASMRRINDTHHTDSSFMGVAMDLTRTLSGGPPASDPAYDAAQEEIHRMASLRRVRSVASIRAEELNYEDVEYQKALRYGLGALFTRIGSLNKRMWWIYLLGIGFSGLHGCAYPLFGIMYGAIISAYSNIDMLVLRHEGYRKALYVFIIAIAGPIGCFLQNLIFGQTAEVLSRKVRYLTFETILRQDVKYFDMDEHSAGLVTSFVNDWAQKIIGFAGVTMGFISQAIITLIAGCIIGLCYDWRIALVGIACYPVTIVSGLVRLHVVVMRDQKNKKHYGHSSTMAAEAVSSIKTLASLTREKEMIDAYKETLDTPVKSAITSALYTTVLFAFTAASNFWVIALSFWYGGQRVVHNGVPPQTFYTTLMSVIFGSFQVGNVFQWVPDMSKAFSAGRDLLTLIDTPIKVDADSVEGIELPRTEGHIVMNDVHFRYPTRPHVPVLRGTSLEILPGQFAAFVGPSGCGKSTMIQLLERFYDVLDGSVTMDGTDIRDINIADYRSHVALVSQEPTLYAGDIRFNICIGLPVPPEQVPQSLIESVCRQANIHDYIMTLPMGYATSVGGKGSQLSGGQKQRIAIARALIRNPKVLLLDEATSALDSESERVVQKALDAAAKGRTTISIAHRLSTIQKADVIFVFKDGVVLEKGKHQELVRQGGLYAQLVQQQALEAHS